MVPRGVDYEFEMFPFEIEALNLKYTNLKYDNGHSRRHTRTLHVYMVGARRIGSCLYGCVRGCVCSCVVALWTALQDPTPPPLSVVLLQQ